MGAHDPAMGNAQLVQACGPRLQLTAVTAREGNMIQASAVLVEYVTRGIAVRMQAEQLPSTDREHSMVKAPDLLVLVQDRLGGQQLAVPAGARRSNSSTATSPVASPVPDNASTTQLEGSSSYRVDTRN